MSTLTRIIAILVGVVVLAVLIGMAWITLGPGPMDFAKGAHGALAGYKGPNPTGVPATLANADLVTRGQYLARAADCESCHTAKGGVPFAGGLGFKLPFGTIYSPNITPDSETGIGSWSDADFLKALHQGVGKGGKPLYPALPYAAYTYMTDTDALAIKAYLFSLTPVHNTAPANTLSFPYNQRWLMRVWAFLFDPDKRFEPNSAQTAQWNRGAYLVEALGHCGDCHTPRNLMQALNNRQKFSGAIASGWRAYNITNDRDAGIGAWSDAQIAQLLSSGHAQGRGIAAGPMGEVVDLSLRHLAPGDIQAIVAYLRTVPALSTPGQPAPKTTPAAQAPKDGGVIANANPLGKQIFEGACASCHGWSGAGSLTPYATLTGNRSVNDPRATNVAQIVLSGTRRQSTHGYVFMPAFGHAYSDTEIAAVANYVTARFGAKGSSLTAKNVAGLRALD